MLAASECESLRNVTNETNNWSNAGEQYDQNKDTSKGDHWIFLPAMWSHMCSLPTQVTARTLALARGARSSVAPSSMCCRHDG